MFPHISSNAPLRGLGVIGFLQWSQWCPALWAVVNSGMLNLEWKVQKGRFPVLTFGLYFQAKGKGQCLEPFLFFFFSGDWSSESEHKLPSIHMFHLGLISASPELHQRNNNSLGTCAIAKPLPLLFRCSKITSFEGKLYMLFKSSGFWVMAMIQVVYHAWFSALQSICLIISCTQPDLATITWILVTLIFLLWSMLAHWSTIKYAWIQPH